ncbi:Dihydroorotase [hydrothermal vent metagenome]|uniref:dihydroorotase n=1 Tax=hydrothermal vent metagenome TaxID=652676 RepID=A0A3B0W528_9ZZZZ
MTKTTLTITQPDDWHLHLRDGEALASVAPFTAKQFARAIVMPNLNPPITTVVQAVEYLDEILAAVDGTDFEPLMTLYLTDNTPPEEIIAARKSCFIKGLKLYPAGATTNSDAGVTNIKNCSAALEEMQKAGLPLLIHGEVTDPKIDIFDREKSFIDKTLSPLTQQFPELKIVFEHITTKEATEFVQQSGDNIAATITPQHLLLNRNALFQGGIQPHNYCLPVLKRDIHQQALLAVIRSGNKKFFLGTDSAPHSKHKKENACGCAGIFSAHAAIEIYTSIFEQQNALDKLEAFASFNGPDFYGLPRNSKTITLIKEDWSIPDEYPLGSETLVPFLAGQTIGWKLSKTN